MPTSTGERITRSRSRSRRGDKGPRKTTPNSKPTQLQAQSFLSPTHDDQVPPASLNTPSTTGNPAVPPDFDQKSKVTVALKDNITCHSPVLKLTCPSDSSLQKETGSAPAGVSDNMASEHQPSEDHPGDPPTDPLTRILADIQEIKTETRKLAKIEASVDSLFRHFSEMTQRTLKLETASSDTTTQIGVITEEIQGLKQEMQLQAKTISEVQKLKEDFSLASKENVSEMSVLVNEQKDQLASFQTTSKNLKKDILSEVNQRIESIPEVVYSKAEVDQIVQQAIQEFKSSKEVYTKEEVEQRIKQVEKVSQEGYTKAEVDKMIKQVEKDAQYNSLKAKASGNKLNLVLTGLPEDDSKTTYELAKDFIEKTLKIKESGIDVAYRLGSTPDPGSLYARPVVVRFIRVYYRNMVWKKRVDITQDDDGRMTRVNTDMPKRLRDDLRILNRVAKAASKLQEFKSAKVQDYRLLFKGKSYPADMLETLPVPIRPSTLASPMSDTTVAFYSKYSMLSNHFPAMFRINEQNFNSMEQYLAFRKAKLSGQQPMIQRALHAHDPVKAKAVLNTLSNDHPQEWNNEVGNILLEGLRAKFSQIIILKNCLGATGQREIGEASLNEKWGVGMTLDNPDILDVTKWKVNGNLLGKSLMKVRQEFAEASYQCS